jgi:ankyrin repeat protein
MLKPINLNDPDVWAMLTAARDGDLERIKSLVQQSPRLATCEYNYTPPIHFAVREGHLEVTRFLLDHGADPANYRTYPFQDSLLTMARDREYDDVAQLLLEYLSKRGRVVEGLETLLSAARAGDVALVKAELERDPSLARAANDTGDTALHQAVEGQHVELVRLLLDAGADVEAKRANGVRPINLALRYGNRELAQLLLDRGAAYTIYIAAVFGDLEFVREALDRDSSLANFEDSSTAHPLSAATNRNDIEMVKLLLAHGANPSLPEEGAPLGQPLWTAVYQRHLELVPLLLEHGANPNTAPESSGSVLLHARGDEELTALLIRHGAVPENNELRDFENAIDDNDLSRAEEFLKASRELIANPKAFWSQGVLAGPARSNDSELTRLLLRYGAKVPDVSQWARYYYFKHLEIARLLLENGMNPNHMNWHHTTLLHDMAHEGDVAKAGLLLDHGADINAVDEEYRSTPLGIAARWGNLEMVKFLLSRGADPNLSGAPWSKPLTWAHKKGHKEISLVLLQSLSDPFCGRSE